MFEAFEEKDIKPRRGQLSLICAGPGTGKSGLILTYALRSKVPTLYFSADSDAFDQLSRSISILTGWSLAKSKATILQDDVDLVREQLGSVPIRLNYDASPTVSVIENSVESYEEVYGEYPTLIVVDNITNVSLDSEGDDAYSSLEGLMEYLHTMARATDAHVMGLHHVTGEYNNAEKPIPLNGVKGQIARVPQLVLTMFKKQGIGEGPDTLCISPVKNRGGKSDPSGQTYAELPFFGASMSIRDFAQADDLTWNEPPSLEEEERRNQEEGSPWEDVTWD